MNYIRSFILSLVILFGPATVTRGIPPNFAVEQIAGPWDQAVGIAFDSTGRAFVWEKAGRVWIVENGLKSPAPVLDLSEEVGNWNDHGLLGFALDPRFPENGYIYLLYTVDYHHLRHFGTPTYDPQTDHYFHDTIARLTRYTCILQDGRASADMSSRRILIGATLSDGIPVCHRSHSAGSLVFGADGTLLASCGDGAGVVGPDIGGNSTGSSNTCLSDGIIRPAEDVGAFRAQMVNSLGGKILRLDSESGAGVPGNPFFDPAAPNSPASRTWALGLRNPFRFTIRPGTGTPYAELGDPGTLYVGDVGWNNWEELIVIPTGGLNAGWPLFEGMWLQPAYARERVANLDASNPLYEEANGCNLPFFFFDELLRAGSVSSPPYFPNPCDPDQPIPETVPHFVHQRPKVDWNHDTAQVRVLANAGTYDSVHHLGIPGSPILGAAFPGSASNGGVWYTGSSFPNTYQNTYFHGDYAGRWIRNFVFDENDELLEVREFMENADTFVVTMAVHPFDGSLWYAAFSADGSSGLSRIQWVENFSPVARARTGTAYGPAPLTVALDGSSSFDPDSQSLSYLWDFKDGTPGSRLPSPVHVFPSEDITESGTPIAKVNLLEPPGPQGLGSPTINVMLDNVWPETGTAEPDDQFDTFHSGDQGNEDWIGLTFPQERRLHGVFFQEGMHFANGGWFEEFEVQVLLADQWTTVPNISVSPPYGAGNTVMFETFEIHFDPVISDGLRLWGDPGGSANFISVAELRVIAEPVVVPVEPVNYTVELSVSDLWQSASSSMLSISVNNTPPEVEIASPSDGSLYSIDRNTIVPLVANICDAEHDEWELTCRWQTTLHHNDHTHPEPIDTNCVTTTVLGPTACDGESYFYEITLAVTDMHGLTTEDSVRLFPDCPPVPGDQDLDMDVDLDDASRFISCFGAGVALQALCQPSDINSDQVVDLADFQMLHDTLTGPRSGLR